MKYLAILVYVDNNSIIIDDFSWLYKSWIYSGNYKTSDIIAYCHPSVINQLPDENGIIKIPVEPIAEPDSIWRGYPFINSIGCLIGPHMRWLIGKYEYALRTDCDVFLTEKLINFKPNRPCFGNGRYAENESVREKIRQVAKKLDYNHHGIHNIGSSLLSRTPDVIELLIHQYKLAERLLLTEFINCTGIFPDWSKQVLTMYAGEIVANHYLSHLLINNMLDQESMRANTIHSDDLHIHAFHTNEYFSKHHFRAGLYNDIDTTRLNPTIINQYCHWIAATSVMDIKNITRYPEI